MGKLKNIDNSYLMAQVPGIAAYAVPDITMFDPASADADVRVIYCMNSKSISLHTSSGCIKDQGSWAGIDFIGDSRSCSSPKAGVFSPRDAMAVWSAIAVSLDQW